MFHYIFRTSVSSASLLTVLFEILLRHGFPFGPSTLFDALRLSHLESLFPALVLNTAATQILPSAIPNSLRSCSRHGVVAAGLTSERPVLNSAKNIQFVFSSDRTIFRRGLNWPVNTSLSNAGHSVTDRSNLHYLLPTGNIFAVAYAVDIMEIDRKHLVMHPQRLPSHHLAFPSAPRASNLVPNARIHTWLVMPRQLTVRR
jgi:hypothetical protein